MNFKKLKMEFYEKQKDKNFFAFNSSSLITFFVFCVFGGQKIFSDVVTFGMLGDQLQLCYSSFVKLGDFLSKGIISGVDANSSNGATEFFLRAQIPVMYFPNMIFAWLGNITGKQKVFYILFYAIHLEVALYYAQKLGKKFFSMDNWRGLLLASSCLPLLLYEMWYSSHAIVTFLFFPLLYFSISNIIGYKKKFWWFLPLPFVLSFTAGYITLAVALVGICIIISISYGIIYRKDLSLKKILFRVFSPVMGATAICFLYYTNVLLYIKMIVKPAGNTLFDAVSMNLDVRNFVLIIFSSFAAINGIEQLAIINIGVIWSIVIFLIVKYETFRDMSKADLLFMKIGVGINILLLLVATGMSTPLGAWFYSLLPILGQTHLPIRYMMVTIPIFYISMSIAFKYLPEGKENAAYKKVSFVGFVTAIIYALVSSRVSIPVFNSEKLVLELLGMAVIMYAVYCYGWHSHKVIILWSVILLFTGINIFYEQNQLNVLYNDFMGKSIVYNDYAQKQLNNYIDTLDKKSQYKFAHLDASQSVTVFIPGNYEWFGISSHDITNYIGHDIHTCLPKEYSNSFPWFNILNWEYILNTRGDFIVADQASIANYQNVFDKVIDWDKSNIWISNEFRICTLKKYVPTYLTQGVQYIEDSPNVLDNGYFYSHDLSTDALTDFSTNDANYYKATVNAPVNATMAFLLYPNRYYQYYVDGKLIKPEIYKMQAFWKIEKGQHVIEVRYENKMNHVSNIILFGYYSISGVVAIILLGERLYRRKINDFKRVIKN